MILIIISYISFHMLTYKPSAVQYLSVRNCNLSHICKQGVHTKDTKAVPDDAERPTDQNVNAISKC